MLFLLLVVAENFISWNIFQQKEHSNALTW